MTSPLLLDRVDFFDIVVPETHDADHDTRAVTSLLSRAESLARQHFLSERTVSSHKAKLMTGRGAARFVEADSTASSASDASASAHLSCPLTFHEDGSRSQFRRLHVEDSMLAEKDDFILIVITPEAKSYPSYMEATVSHFGTSGWTFERVGYRQPLIQIEAKVKANSDGPKIINHLPGPRGLSDSKSLYQQNSGIVFEPIETSLDWTLELSFRDIFTGYVELYDSNPRNFPLKDYYAAIEKYKYHALRPIIERLLQEVLNVIACFASLYVP